MVNIYVIVYDNHVMNIDDSELENYQALGARFLTTEEIERYGMKGYERWITPLNSTINPDGTIQFDKKLINTDMITESIRNKRNLLLEETDKYMTEDYPIDQEKKEKIKAYRQTLRDITKHPEFPLFVSTNNKVPWPIQDW